MELFTSRSFEKHCKWFIRAKSIKNVMNTLYSVTHGLLLFDLLYYDGVFSLNKQLTCPSFVKNDDLCYVNSSPFWLILEFFPLQDTFILFKTEPFIVSVYLSSA